MTTMTADSDIRTNWTFEEIEAIYHMPLLPLIHKASTLHASYHKVGEVQLSTLLSIKTGGCEEDCAYCPQAARYQTGVVASKLLDRETILDAAKTAKQGGSSRFCMGVAWRQVRQGPVFDEILEIVKDVKALGLQVCCTLGMLTEIQAKRLKEAGVYAYNHNLDTSSEYYPSIITTRTYEDRLKTLKVVLDSGMTVCCGGILGMGESTKDRVSLLHTLATLEQHPESVPVNALIPIPGTPLGDQPTVPIWELARMVATARIVMPKAMIRLSAGRASYSHLEQMLCFMAGANSIHTGSKLLVTPLCGQDTDQEMFDLLGLTPMPVPEDSEITIT